MSKPNRQRKVQQTGRFYGVACVPLHFGESPFVIRVEKNDIRLNPQFVQLGDLFLQVISKFLIETGKIKTGFLAPPQKHSSQDSWC